MDKKKLSRPALAKLAGTTRMTIGNYLNSKTKIIEVFLLFSLAEALNVNPVWLLTGRGAREPLKTLNADQERALRTLDKLAEPSLRDLWFKQGDDLIELAEAR